MAIYVDNLSKSLNAALQKVNTDRDNVVVSKGPLGLREPILLELRFKDDPKPEAIGATHFVHLLKEGEVVRTFEELVDSIKKAVDLHFKAKNDNSALIHPKSGTIFYKNNHDFEISKGDQFFINKKVIRYEGKEVEASKFIAEGTVTLETRNNGYIELVNPTDQRKGKGFFISPNNDLVRELPKDHK